MNDERTADQNPVGDRPAAGEDSPETPPVTPPSEAQTMTREKAIELLKQEQVNGDTECAHISADKVLCRLLESLGYADVVGEYRKVDKWFA